MYLSEINEVDDSWPSIDELEDEAIEDVCLDHFHRLLLLRELKAAKDTCGPVWQRLRETFGTLANCGFTDAEIDLAPPSSFQRETPEQKRLRVPRRGS